MSDISFNVLQLSSLSKAYNQFVCKPPVEHPCSSESIAPVAEASCKPLACCCCAELASLKYLQWQRCALHSPLQDPTGSTLQLQLHVTVPDDTRGDQVVSRRRTVSARRAGGPDQPGLATGPALPIDIVPVGGGRTCVQTASQRQCQLPYSMPYSMPYRSL